MSQVFAIAGAVTQASGQIMEGNAQDAAYKYNADINERNAQVAEQQADQLVRREEEKIVDFQKDFRKFSDAQSQAFRYNGCIASEGTPLKVALASAQEAEEEIATRRYNAKVSSGALEENAAQERMQATLNRMYGKTARRAGQIRATTTLLNQAAESTKMGMFS
tara:strand:- start:215 stop:706 length:492 start_codon:yes stop_codon:yes gene_type:complete